MKSFEKMKLAAAALAFFMAASPGSLKAAPDPKLDATELLTTPGIPSIQSEIEKSVGAVAGFLKDGKYHDALFELHINAARYVYNANAEIRQAYDSKIDDLLKQSVEGFEPRVPEYLEENPWWVHKVLQTLEHWSEAKTYIKDERKLSQYHLKAYAMIAVDVVNQNKEKLAAMKIEPLKVDKQTKDLLFRWVAGYEINADHAGGRDKLSGLDDKALRMLYLRYQQADSGWVYQTLMQNLNNGDYRNAVYGYSLLGHQFNLYKKAGGYRILGFKDRDIISLNTSMKKAIPGFQPNIMAKKPTKTPALKRN